MEMYRREVRTGDILKIEGAGKGGDKEASSF